MSDDYSDIARQAKAVLDKNWTGKFTIPAEKLYPHQWSWDAALIAIGYAHYQQEHAQQELLHLFTGQWSNGLLPHIVFSDEAQDYFPGPAFWRIDRSNYTPGNTRTSGIVQPPLHATAALYIYTRARDKQQARGFLARLYPKLCTWHDYLHKERDPDRESLAYIRHPWESGMDNSPIWDSIFNKIHLSGDQIPDYERSDTKTVDPKDRPDNKTYDRYVYLVKLFYDNDYDEAAIREKTPFLVQDVLFNALLARGDADLARIAQILGKDAALHAGRASSVKEAMNRKLWDPEQSIYFDYDMKNNEIIPSHVASGFIPLFSGVPDKNRADKMLKYLDSAHFDPEHGRERGIPSYDEKQPGFSPNRYWRGPVWININWFLYEGLKQYGFDEYGEWVRDSIIRLVRRHGFYEYYNPHNGTGHGADEFSWSASLLLDVLYREELI